ncbi:sigma-70 family RNA polymerase sigma factor [Isosphaeraceae bacterium EP7]
MRTIRQVGDTEGLAALDRPETQVLGALEERKLLDQLGECRRKLSEALESIKPPDEAEMIAGHLAFRDSELRQVHESDGPAEARLGAIFRHYSELRGRLAMANMRLVAHIAKRFRDRGVSYSDLLQEGFCGLLESIDRFDLTRETKLATYATWWIRQAMQRAVAAGAYPVRLSPRHLRQLAQDQESVGHDPAAGLPPLNLNGSTEMIRRIHTATRPTVSLDATLDVSSNFSLLQTMSDPDADPSAEVDMDETVGRLLGALNPREKEVLALRFGLGGKSKHSLSQVGKLLSVSKERVRQIQDRALEKLRDSADNQKLMESLLPGV